MFGVPECADWQYVTDPHWRSSYEAPRWVFDMVGKDSTATMQKIVELIEKFYGEFIDEGTCIAIKHELLPFVGDRDLTVKTYMSFDDRSVLIEFDDDDGRRKLVRLT
jgi:hypothetical protein